MNSEFARLYRELGKCTNLEHTPKDISYDRERKEVLKKIGYDIKGIKPLIAASKHHGKSARRLEPERKLTALQQRGQEILINRKKKQFNDLMLETDKINTAAKEISKLLSQDHPIPSLLMKQLAPSVPKKVQEPEQSPTTKACTGVGLDLVVPRSVSKLSFMTSENKWTLEERDRLNQLYTEIKRPPIAHKGMWRLYYETIADRFRCFYPQRTMDEVVTKVEEMVTTRKMKEPGESEYWKDLQGSPKPDKYLNYLQNYNGYH